MKAPIHKYFVKNTKDKVINFVNIAKYLLIFDMSDL
jgi:hypothetical protein